ncbi:MAG: hypothetical protein AAF215_21820 [Cyanobacteria bacterium P01_A01_bin.123]
MFATLMDRLGDHNPQLLRELKGRLRWRNILIAVGLSLLAQLLMLLTFMSQLPAPFHNSHLKATTTPAFNFQFDYPTDGSSEMPKSLLVDQVYDNQNPVLIRSGDRIMAIDGKSVADFGGDWNAVDTALNGKLNPDWDTVYPGDELVNSEVTAQAIEDVENSTVELEVKRNGQTLNIELDRQAIPNYYNIYCVPSQPLEFNVYARHDGKCMLEPDGQHYQVAWSRWYRDFFRVVSIVMAVALLSAGSFLLIQNIDREQRRGTLTFVRLSPRSALTVLGGQILGVPMVVYIAIALCLPLHLGMGLLAGLNPLALATFYGFLLINSVFFFSLSLLYGLLSQGLGGFQAWLFSGAMLGGQLIFGTSLSLEDWGNRDVHHWLALFSPMAALHYILQIGPELSSDDALSFAGIGLSFFWFSVLFAVNGLMWSLWVWHGLRRKFINPTTPLVHRPLSYLLTVCFEVFLLGFGANSLDTDVVLAAVAFLNLLYFGLLIAALQPTPQAMADWARFRHAQPKRQRSNRLQDWLLSNQSSPIVALAANLMLALVMVTTWVLLTEVPTPLDELLSYVACMSLILVYGAVTQIIFMGQMGRPSLWATVTLVLLVSIPLFSLAVLYSTAYIGTTTRIALLAAPWLISIEGASMGLRLFGLLGQWTAILACTGIVARRLKQIGASESQAMLTGSGRLPRGA